MFTATAGSPFFSFRSDRKVQLLLRDYDDIYHSCLLVRWFACPFVCSFICSFICFGVSIILKATAVSPFFSFRSDNEIQSLLRDYDEHLPGTMVARRMAVDGLEGSLVRSFVRWSVRLFVHVFVCSIVGGRKGGKQYRSKGGRKEGRDEDTQYAMKDGRKG